MGATTRRGEAGPTGMSSHRLISIHSGIFIMMTKNYYDFSPKRKKIIAEFQNPQAHCRTGGATGAADARSKIHVRILRAPARLLQEGRQGSRRRPGRIRKPCTSRTCISLSHTHTIPSSRSRSLALSLSPSLSRSRSLPPPLPPSRPPPTPLPP